MNAETSAFHSTAHGGDGQTPARGRASGGHTTDARTAREVVFYRLGKKFVDDECSIPEDVRSVLYYTLAIGHHTGVIDCLEPRVSTSRAVFAEVLGMLPEGQARDKLAGIERFGEIQIDKEHVEMLRVAVGEALDRLGMVSCAVAGVRGEPRAEAQQVGAQGVCAEARRAEGVCAEARHAEARRAEAQGVGTRDACAEAQGVREGHARPCVCATDAPSWLEEFAALLDEVASEPQVYAMGRRVTL